MKWAYNIIAYDESGDPIKEILRTPSKSKAEAILDELEEALEKRAKRIRGVRVAEYGIERDLI